MNKTTFIILLVSLFLFLQLAFSQEVLEKIFVIEFILYKNDTVELLDFKISEGTVSLFHEAGEPNYNIKIISTDKKVLFSQNMHISFYAAPDAYGNISVPLVELEKQHIYLKLPFFSNGEKIELYHDGKLIFQYIIKWCNKNGICESDKNENYINCFDDCHCGNNICDKIVGETFANCPQDCPAEKPKTLVYIYLIIIGVIVAIIAFFLYKIKVVK